MPNIDEQLKSLINELNIGHLSEDEQGQILEALGDIALKRVLVTVFDRVPENVRDPLADMIEKDDQEGIQKIFAEHVPDIADIVAAALQTTVEEHKRLVGEEVGFDEGEDQAAAQ